SRPRRAVRRRRRQGVRSGARPGRRPRGPARLVHAGRSSMKNRLRRIMRLCAPAALCTIAALGTRAGIAFSAAPPAEKIIVGWSAIAGSQAPVWITKEAGLFEKNGLDVTLIYIDGGSKATQALLSGDVPIAQIGGAAPVVARVRGADVTMIAGLTNVLAYSLVVVPEIKKPEDLKGKKLSVSRFGSNS